MSNLTSFYQWFHSYYASFYSTDATIMAMVDLKENHSLRVAKHARNLADSLYLSAQKLDLAEIIGLLHDIARSEQAHLKTFNDSITFDHGDRGVLRLKEAGILDSLDSELQDIILFSIEHHNKIAIPVANPDKTLFAKIIKDADKLDIFKVLPPIMAGHDYSPLLVDLLRQGRVLPYSEVKTEADKKLVRLAWLFDIHFPWTIKQLFDAGYVKDVLEALPDAHPFDEIKKNVMKFLSLTT